MIFHFSDHELEKNSDLIFW